MDETGVYSRYGHGAAWGKRWEGEDDAYDWGGGSRRRRGGWWIRRERELRGAGRELVIGGRLKRLSHWEGRGKRETLKGDSEVRGRRSHEERDDEFGNDLMRFSTGCLATKHHRHDCEAALCALVSPDPMRLLHTQPSPVPLLSPSP